MTTPIVPGFIADLFKKEIYNIQMNLIDKICEVYGLSRIDVVKKLDLVEVEFGNCNLRIIHKIEGKYGSKTNKPKCIARVYDKNERTLCQCIRSQKEGCGSYCKSHFNLVAKKPLTFGTINDPVPDDVKQKLTKKIY